MNYKLQIANYKLAAIFCAIILSCGVISPLFAQNLTPNQEARFNKLALEIRCVVCQSEPVATSQAKIAIDMRDVIRQRIAAGDSDKQVRQYFADHYGEYVLLRPQLNGATIALWATPFALLAFAGVFLFFIYRKQNQTSSSLDSTSNSNSLSETEKAEALAALKALEADK